MRRRQRTYILSIPTVSALSADMRRLIESILRRRSDGPIIVKERKIETARGESLAQTKALWAIFADRQQARLAKEDLQSIFFHLQVVEREEWRRPVAREAPCSCELTGVRFGGAYYRGVRHCERHACLLRNNQEEQERLPGCEPGLLAPLSHLEEVSPPTARAKLSSKPLGRRCPLREARILALSPASEQ